MAVPYLNVAVDVIPDHRAVDLRHLDSPQIPFIPLAQLEAGETDWWVSTIYSHCSVIISYDNMVKCNIDHGLILCRVSRVLGDTGDAATMERKRQGKGWFRIREAAKFGATKGPARRSSLTVKGVRQEFD